MLEPRKALARAARTYSNPDVFRRYAKADQPGAEAQGWALHRQLKRDVVLRVAKDPARRRRDKFWSVLYGLELDHLNQPLDQTGRDMVLGVAAKGEHQAAVVGAVWTDGRVANGANLRKMSSEMEALRASVPKAMERMDLPTARFILVENPPSPEEQQAAREHKAFLLDEAYLDYLLEMTGLLGPVMRMQVLGPALEETDLDGVTVDAVRASMHGHTYYAFTAKARQLLPLLIVRRYGDPALGKGNVLLGYQRVPMRNRLAKIRDHVDRMGALFPNSIVLNIEGRDGERLATKQVPGHPNMVRLTLPRRFHSMSIIDGQHRLLGLYDTAASKQDDLPIVAFDGLKPEIQSRIFIDINSRQRKVRANLLQSLYADLKWSSSDRTEQLEAVTSTIVHALGKDPKSPLLDRIRDETSRGADRTVTFTTIYQKLAKKALVGRADAAEFQPGPLGSRRDDWRQATVNRATKVLMAYFGTLERHAPTHWKKGGEAGGYLRTSNGVAAALEALAEMLDFHCPPGEHTTDSDVVAAATKYAEPIGRFFEKAGSNEIQAFRSMLGAAGQRTAGLMMLEKVQENYPSFKPPALESHKAKVSPEAIEKARKVVNSLERRLRSAVVAGLKQKHPGGEAWWREGLQLKVRTRARRREEQLGTPQALENLLTVKDLVDAARSVWPTVSAKLAYPQSARGKTKQSAWLDDLVQASKELNRKRPAANPDTLARLDSINEQLKS